MKKKTIGWNKDSSKLFFTKLFIFIFLPISWLATRGKSYPLICGKSAQNSLQKVKVTLSSYFLGETVKGNIPQLKNHQKTELKVGKQIKAVYYTSLCIEIVLVKWWFSLSLVNEISNKKPAT